MSRGIPMKSGIKFDKTNEPKYRKDKFDNDLVYIRIVLILCVFFYSIFGLIDLYLDIPETSSFLVIRFFFVNPFFVFGFLMSFHKSFEKTHQLILIIAYFAAGFGIITMLIIAPDNYSYYGGLFLIFGVGHFLTRIYWKYVSAATVTMIVVMFGLSMVFVGDFKSNFIYTFFYINFTVICIYGSYIFERYRRAKYLQAHNLLENNVVLERQIYEKLIELEKAHRTVVFSLAQLAESKDHFTGEHLERVGYLCLMISQNLPESIYLKNNIDRDAFINTIELASTLHDVGKIVIPESILMKPGKLTDEEMSIMRKHTTLGYEALLRINEKYGENDFIKMGLNICKYHHERFDGTGYPDKLKGEEIPLSARIVSIIDVYDALISERPYKKSFDKAYSRAIIKEGAGTMFDPEIVDVFLELML